MQVFRVEVALIFKGLLAAIFDSERYGDETEIDWA